MENFRQANRRLANVAACKASAEFTGRREQAEQGGDGRQCDAAADDCGTDGNMRTISADEAKVNIVRAYERQHQESVDAISAAIERVKATKTTDAKAKSVSVPKPSLAELLLAGGEE
jgi:hypothetical protein